MPRLVTDEGEQHALAVDAFGYSAARIGDLQATEYTLVSIVCDDSGSVEPFRADMENAIKEVVKACRYSPRADNLMIRLTVFSNQMKEIHGFKLLQDCAPDAYGGVLRLGGTTALYDAAANAVEAANDYGRKLVENDFSANGIVIVITDGLDNASSLGRGEVKKALARAVKEEKLESLVSILIGVNILEKQISDELVRFYKEAGFTQYVEMQEASSRKLARLAEFVSKSISAQSQALGTGGPSKPLTF